MAKVQKLVFLLSTFYFLLSAPSADAAVLSLSPSSGTFTVGGTFEVSILLNTQNEAINTIAVNLRFPADKLQLISPSAGRSIIDIWLTPPKFNNQTGAIELKGGIPGGLNVSSGLVTKLTFRVSALGEAIIKFLDGSMVLLNDGLGTDALRQTEAGVYDLAMPPPAGPITVSPTHPQQAGWYPSPNAILNWATDEGVNGYSYILDDNAVNVPDDVSEGTQNTVLYKNLSSGRHYFHIKALRKGIWGGITHFIINIDTEPPAEFPIEIIPSSRTNRLQPVVQFTTTDDASGIDHYELRIIPLNTASGRIPDGIDQPFFIETDSPYVTPPLEIGSYDVIVRAYDKAKNYRESVQNIKIVTAIFQFISDKGLEIKGGFIIGWIWFWLAGGILLAGLGVLAWYLRRRHYQIEHASPRKELPGQIKEQLGELQKYRDKYGQMLVAFLAIGVMFSFGNRVLAVAATGGYPPLNPPVVTLVSKNISNEEIFYVGGKTEVSNVQITIYLQNLQTGETYGYTVISDKNGDWFYRHDRFLLSGNYLLWVQGQIENEKSPPGPQVSLVVRPTAIQFGSSRLSYENVYLMIALALLISFIVLIAYIIFHGYHIRKKRSQFIKEIKEAEEAVRRGFAVLRRDIQAELEVVKKAKLSKALSEEEKAKEEQLLKDLEDVERYIGKEVFDIEKAEYCE